MQNLRKALYSLINSPQNGKYQGYRRYSSSIRYFFSEIPKKSPAKFAKDQ